MDESSAWYICKFCKKNFQGKHKLLTHRRDAHSSQSQPAKEAGRSPSTSTSNKNSGSKQKRRQNSSSDSDDDEIFSQKRRKLLEQYPSMADSFHDGDKTEEDKIGVMILSKDFQIPSASLSPTGSVSTVSLPRFRSPTNLSGTPWTVPAVKVLPQSQVPNPLLQNSSVASSTSTACTSTKPTTSTSTTDLAPAPAPATAPSPSQLQGNESNNTEQVCPPVISSASTQSSLSISSPSLDTTVAPERDKTISNTVTSISTPTSTPTHAVSQPSQGIYLNENNGNNNISFNNSDVIGNDVNFHSGSALQQQIPLPLPPPTLAPSEVMSNTDECMIVHEIISTPPPPPQPHHFNHPHLTAVPVPGVSPRIPVSAPIQSPFSNPILSTLLGTSPGLTPPPSEPSQSHLQLLQQHILPLAQPQNNATAGVSRWERMERVEESLEGRIQYLAECQEKITRHTEKLKKAHSYMKVYKDRHRPPSAGAGAGVGIGVGSGCCPSSTNTHDFPSSSSSSLSLSRSIQQQQQQPSHQNPQFLRTPQLHQNLEHLTNQQQISPQPQPPNQVQTVHHRPPVQQIQNQNYMQSMNYQAQHQLPPVRIPTPGPPGLGPGPGPLATPSTDVSSQQQFTNEHLRLMQQLEREHLEQKQQRQQQQEQLLQQQLQQQRQQQLKQRLQHQLQQRHQQQIRTMLNTHPSGQEVTDREISQRIQSPSQNPGQGQGQGPAGLYHVTENGINQQILNHSANAANAPGRGGGDSSCPSIQLDPVLEGQIISLLTGRQQLSVGVNRPELAGVRALDSSNNNSFSLSIPIRGPVPTPTSMAAPIPTPRPNAADFFQCSPRYLASSPVTKTATANQNYAFPQPHPPYGAARVSSGSLINADQSTLNIESVQSLAINQNPTIQGQSSTNNAYGSPAPQNRVFVYSNRNAQGRQTVISKLNNSGPASGSGPPDTSQRHSPMLAHRLGNGDESNVGALQPSTPTPLTHHHPPTSLSDPAPGHVTNTNDFSRTTPSTAGNGGPGNPGHNIYLNSQSQNPSQFPPPGPQPQPPPITWHRRTNSMQQRLQQLNPPPRASSLSPKANPAPTSAIGAPASQLQLILTMNNSSPENPTNATPNHVVSTNTAPAGNSPLGQYAGAGTGIIRRTLPQPRATSIVNNSVAQSPPSSLQAPQSPNLATNLSHFLSQGQGQGPGIRKGALLTPPASPRLLPAAPPRPTSRSSSNSGSPSLRMSSSSPAAVHILTPPPPTLPKVGGVSADDEERRRSGAGTGTGATTAEGQSATSTTPTPTTTLVRFVCHICDAVLLTAVAFEHHLKSHQVNVQVAYGCSICKARFSSQYERDKHLFVHGQGPGQSGRKADETPAQSDDDDDIQIVAEIARPVPVRPPTTSLTSTAPGNIGSVEKNTNTKEDANTESRNENAETAPPEGNVDVDLGNGDDDTDDVHLESVVEAAEPEPQAELEEPSLCYICRKPFSSLQSLKTHIFKEHVDNSSSSEGGVNNSNGESSTGNENHSSSRVTTVNGHGVIKLEPESENSEKSLRKDNPGGRELEGSVSEDGDSITVQDYIETMTTTVEGPGGRNKFRCRGCGIGFPTVKAAEIHVTFAHKFLNNHKRRGRTKPRK